MRCSGKIIFLQLRDGTGVCEMVCSEEDVSPDIFTKVKNCRIESSVKITGYVHQHWKQKDTHELVIKYLEIIGKAIDYPLGRKAHGPDYLMGYRP